MRYVANLVAFAKPYDAWEIVLDDPEVIAVIIDVGRQEKRIAAGGNQLLALVRSAPVDRKTELIGLDDSGRLGEPFSYLREESQIAVRGSLVAGERGVSDLSRSSLGGLLYERAGTRIVPCLSK